MATQKSSSRRVFGISPTLFILLSVLILCIVFLTMLYTFRYLRFNEVYFSQGEAIQKWSTLNDLPDTVNIISIEWVTIEYNPNFDASIPNTFSTYTIRITHTAPASTSFRVQALLHANWMDYRFTSRVITVNSFTTQRTNDIAVETNRNIRGFAFFPIIVRNPRLFLRFDFNGEIFFVNMTDIIANGNPAVI